MEYMILAAERGSFAGEKPYQELTTKVNEAMKQGWRPAGGIATLEDHTLMQAMTRGKR